MTITLRQAVNPHPIGQWVLPKTPPFLFTPEYRLLLRELQRYVDGEIAGRSYLIAGHRGAGKTALVTRAVEDLRTACLQASEKSTGAGGRQPLRRPLLVRLYGPSLLEPLPPTEAEATAEAKAKAAKGDRHRSHRTPDEEEAAASSQAALVQIAIALYRALAGEISEGFSAHARERVFETGDRGLGREEVHELAGQLALELDTVTPPSLLRTYWHRLGRLGLGVLWPSRADQTLQDRGLFDQAVREIVAVTTAGQAFEVCSGTVNYKVTGGDTASDSAEVKASGKTDFKDVASRVGALVAGGITTTALWTADRYSAVWVGIAVWMLGSVTLTWTGQRTRKQQRATEYAFLRDRSLQTLDRDLPLVISRVREAGLAPVFMVDELDKVDRAAEKIRLLIQRLKHIVSDYGFFCFLTDRDYFDHVDRLVREKAFPKEHTYFSRRRLIAYAPDAIEAFLRDRYVTSGDRTEQAAHERFVYASAHGSQLNFASLMRAVDIDEEADGDVSARLLKGSGQIDVQLAANLQLAIDEVLADPTLSRRIERDAGFAQLAHDALYAVSRAWEEDRTDFDGSESALVEELKKRVDGEATPMPASDTRLLAEKLEVLLDYLCDFTLLHNDLIRRADDRASRAGLVVTTFGGLIRRVHADRAFYTFNFDSCGQDRRESELVHREVETLADLITAIEELTAKLDISLADLTDSGLLPNSLTSEALAAAKTPLARWRPDAPPSRELAQAVAAARGLRTALENDGVRLASGLALARVLASAADRPGLSIGLTVLARYPDFGELASKDSGVSAWRSAHPALAGLMVLPPVPSEPSDLREWTDREASDLMSVAVAVSQVPTTRRWASWLPRFEAWFGGATSANEVDFEDLVSAAQGLEPNAILREPLSTVGALEWSGLLLAALPKQQDSAPRWGLVAAMRALGFSGRILEDVALAQDRFGEQPIEADVAVRLAQAPVANRDHILALHKDFEGFEREPEAGVLHVTYSDYDVHRLDLDWLQSLRAFNGLAFDDEQTDLPVA